MLKTLLPSYTDGELLYQKLWNKCNMCRDKIEIELLPSQLMNKKIARRGHMQTPGIGSTHILNCIKDKEKEKELLLLNGLSKEDIYPLTEINFSQQQKWCLTCRTTTYITVNYIICLQIYKSNIQCHNYYKTEHYTERLQRT